MIARLSACWCVGENDSFTLNDPNLFANFLVSLRVSKESAQLFGLSLRPFEADLVHVLGATTILILYLVIVEGRNRLFATT
jgi:hypothetical protein